MGTNYYWVRPPRHDSEYVELEGARLHICKLSGGWKPLFQGWPDPEGKDPVIVSVEGFKDLFASEPGGHIEDENGYVWEQKLFWEKIADWQNGRNLIDHLKYMAKRHPEYMSDYWRDDEGFEFDKRDFS